MRTIRESSEIRNVPRSSDHLSSPLLPSSIRRSMNSYQSIPPTPLSSPPTYSEFPFPSPLRHFNIQPREDEGREILPPYSTAISLQSVFLQKHELEHAVHKASDRSWHHVMVALQGTALTFHKCRIPGIFSQFSSNKATPDYPTGTTKGQFLKSYNLTHADVGIAADYIKRKYVIRVRAETEQFLLSCHKIETFVLWLQSLFAAIDLAPPLDDREIPLDLSIPRRPRRRRRAVVTESEVEAGTRIGDAERILNEQLLREQEIMRSFPDLGVGGERVMGEIGEGEDDESEGTISPAPSPAEAPCICTPNLRPSPFSAPARSSLLHSATIPSHTSSSISFPQLLLRTRAIFSSSSLPLIPTTPSHPSLTTDGKWAPEHQWTHFYDMLYAKRCMAILTHRSPRKSKYVIVKGKRCVVDWATGRVERCEPPGYGEWELRETGTRGTVKNEARDREKRVGFKRSGKRVLFASVQRSE